MRRLVNLWEAELRTSLWNGGYCSYEEFTTCNLCWSQFCECLVTACWWDIQFN